MHAISFSLSVMHDITAYMFCSLELNMRALLMCVCVCVRVQRLSVCPCPPHPYRRGRALWCVSTVACLEAAEL